MISIKDAKEMTRKGKNEEFNVDSKIFGEVIEPLIDAKIRAAAARGENSVTLHFEQFKGYGLKRLWHVRELINQTYVGYSTLSCYADTSMESLTISW